MALFTPSESPAVVVKEIDLTGGVPNVQSTTGAIAGQFRWGPVEEATTIANETGLVNTFASPADSNGLDFLAAAQFLKYSSSLQVVRVGDSAMASSLLLSNGDSLGSTDIASQVIKNKTQFDDEINTFESLISSQDSTTNVLFASRFPGEIGNSLRIEYVGTQDSANASVFTSWSLRNSFSRTPTSTIYATQNNAKNDAICLAVVDRLGKISGTANSVLEVYENVSVIKGAKNTDGTNIYVKDVINAKSEYIYMVNFDAAQVTAGAGAVLPDGLNALNVKNYARDSAGVQRANFFNGSNGGTIGVSEYLTGFDKFEDKDAIEVDFLIAPGLNSQTDQVTIVNDLVATAGTTRKDCVVVASPNRDAIVSVNNTDTKVTNTISTGNALTRSSYLVYDNNYVKVYDKYNDKYREIPGASTVAGLMAATDNNRAPWFSPAGARRGQLLGITSINYSPTKSQRDQLYREGINPIANIPGQGTILFGDKTFLGYPSAFDRINVRRLFLVLERAIARAAENVLFEFNDEFTRAEFVNIVEPVLREIKGRRGITDFRVVADETNNTAEVIDRNEFIANIFIKPARSINYVTLNFVAVRTGVEFEEVVGTV